MPTSSLGLCCVSAAALLFELSGDMENANDKLSNIARALDQLTRVTETPHKMANSTTTFCFNIPPTNPKGHEDFVAPAFCNVYVNELAKTPMLAGQGTYPIGSVIIKSKLRSKEKTDVELFTIMRKMPADYDSKHGNWEYSVIDGKSYRVISRGRIDSCIDCHMDYRETDFVTRAYLPKKANDRDKNASRNSTKG